MLIFNQNNITERQGSLEDLNTSHVNLQRTGAFFYSILSSNLNTSHVNLQQLQKTEMRTILCNLNTSHVNLQRPPKKGYKNTRYI